MSRIWTVSTSDTGNLQKLQFLSQKKKTGDPNKNDNKSDSVSHYFPSAKKEGDWFYIPLHTATKQYGMYISLSVYVHTWQIPILNQHYFYPFTALLPVLFLPQNCICP
jgi:hypothetical protein